LSLENPGRFGYTPEGKEFDEAGAPHQLMVTQLRLQIDQIDKEKDDEVLEV